MLSFALANGPEAKYNVLCLGAHSDDIEIGCGGTILKLTRAYPNVSWYWVVFGSSEQRADEARQSANTFLSGARDKQIVVKTFRDGYFPYVGAEIKDQFEQIKTDFAPDLIFTHCRQDLHQDHRLIHELTWNTFRDHTVLEYEIAKYDGDLGSPNIFVPLDEATSRQKIDNLMDHFKSQQSKPWFTADTFLSLMRLRGVECRSATRYAEAFYGRKLVWMDA